MGKYERHSVLSLPGFNNKIIDASVSVFGSDPWERELFNLSRRILDRLLENVFCML